MSHAPSKSPREKPIREKKTSFIPRLAYGVFGLGLGVVPFAAGCGSSSGSYVDPIGTDAVAPRLPDTDNDAEPDGSIMTDASGIDVIFPYVPDGGPGDSIMADASATDAVLPYIPDAAAGDDASAIGDADADL